MQQAIVQPNQQPSGYFESNICIKTSGSIFLASDGFRICNYGRQQIIFVHDINQVGRSHFFHPALLVIKFHDLIVKFQASFWKFFQIPQVFTVSLNPDLCTSALIFLSRKTVPIPPLPACFTRNFPSFVIKRNSGIPIKVCSDPAPADTTDMLLSHSHPGIHLRQLFSQDMSVYIFTGGLNILTKSYPIDINDIFLAFPWISRASNPENFK